MGDLGNVLTDVVTKQYPLLMSDLGNVLTDVVTKQYPILMGDLGVLGLILQHCVISKRGEGNLNL